MSSTLANAYICIYTVLCVHIYINININIYIGTHIPMCMFIPAHLSTSNSSDGTRKRAQWFRIFAVLAEDPGIFLRTHMVAHNHFKDLLGTFLWFLQVPSIHMVDGCRQNIHAHKINRCNFKTAIASIWT